MTIHDRPAVEVDGEPAVRSSFARVGGRLVRTIETTTGAMRSSVDQPVDTGDPLGDWWRAYWAGSRPEFDGAARRTLRTVELFSGTGGLGLGLRQACAELGIPVVSEAAVDHDAEAVEVYRRNHGTRHTSSRSVSVLVDGSVRGARDGARFRYPPEIIDDTLAALRGRVDAVLAGPPCQGHSSLNNRTRRTDPRNELYLAVPAIAVALDAPIVVIENVPAVIHDRVGVVAAATALLEAHGYHVRSGVLHAHRLGWPQSRGRFFVLARKDLPPLEPSAVATALADDPRDVSWAIGDLADADSSHFMDGKPELSDENRRRLQWLFDHDAYDLPFSERPECHQEGTTYTSVYGRLHPDRPAPTITTGFMTPGRGRYVHPTRPRVLTPREAARLQGFPDTYDFRPATGKEPSKAQLGKWIGDAVPMPLGHAAALAVLAPGWPDA